MREQNAPIYVEYARLLSIVTRYVRIVILETYIAKKN